MSRPLTSLLSRGTIYRAQLLQTRDLNSLISSIEYQPIRYFFALWYHLRMQLNRRLIGVSAIFANGNVSDVDLDDLIAKLLLFDKYILTTIRLQEFPILARYLGYEVLRDLLAAKLIEIRCECFQAAQIGQSGLLGDPILPLLTYRFNYIDSHDRRKYIHDCLQCIHNADGLTSKQAIKLKGQIAGLIQPLPIKARSEMFPAFLHELNNPTMLDKSVRMVLKREALPDNIPFYLKIHREGAETFRIETNLDRSADIPEGKAHKVIETGLMGVHGLSQTLVEMKHYCAISGFRDEEMPLLRHKLDFLADAVTSHEKERSFRRVMQIAGIPRFTELGATLNVDKLLTIRDSGEAREFRDWLTGVSEASDDEIKQRVSGLRASVGLKVGGERGKTVRFLINAGIGLVPGATVVGMAVGAFDQFAVDKLLLRSGVTAFVNELYPSIFERK